MLDAKKVYSILLGYIDETLAGAGALKGASCQIQSITDITGGKRITFEWELNDGTSETSTLDVMNGAKGEDGANGQDGVDGVGIVSIEKTSTSGLVDTYTITLSNGDTDTFTVTNGKDGEDGSQVSITQTLTSGTEIAEVDIDGQKTKLYAPQGGGGSDVSSELASLSTENSLQTSEISSLSAENSTQTSELSSLSAENSTQTSELGSLSSENSTQSSEIDSLSTASSENTDAIGSLSQSMSEIASTAGSLSTENSQQNSELGSLSTENSTQSSELSSLSAENSTQTSELDSLSSENSTQSSEIDSLSTAQSELASETTAIGSEVAENYGEFENYSQAVGNIQQKSSTYLAETPTFAGRALLDKMYGMSVQDGTPSPSDPVAINSAKANFKVNGKNLVITPYTFGTTYSGNNVSVTANDDGSLHITTNGGTASSVTWINLVGQINTTFPLKLKARQYHLSCKGITSGLDTNNYFGIIKEGSPIVIARVDSTTVGTGVDVTPTGGNYYVGFRIDNGASVNMTIYPMITLKEVAEPEVFESYKAQAVTTDLTLRAIEVTSSDDYNLVRDGKYYIADTLEKIDGGYQITRRLGEITFDGSEDNWNFDGQYVAFIPVLDALIWPNDEHAIIKSNRFSEIVSRTEIYTTPLEYDVMASFKSQSLQVPILAYRVDGVTTKSGWLTWLGSHNVTSIYILGTPTVESVSLDDVKKLLSLKTYDEATYITQVESIEGDLILEYGNTELTNKTVTGYVEAERNTADLNRGSISVTADGTKTIGTLLSELYLQRDFSKISDKSKLISVSYDNVLVNYTLRTSASNGEVFQTTVISGNDAYVEQLVVASSGAYTSTNTTTGATTDLSSVTIPASGTIYKVIY